MKKEYPRYRNGELMAVKSGLNKKDTEILNKFLIYCSGTAGERKMQNIEIKLLQIRDVSQVPYDKWDLDKLRSFLSLLNKSNLSPATKNDIKKTLKRFLKDYYSDWSSRFKELKDVKGENDINQEKLNADTILTSKELERIIRTAETLRYKALIILSYETGARPNEILSLKWKDINLDREEVKLTSTKNKKVRVLVIKEAVIHLKRYKQEFPFPDVQPNDFLFPSKDRKEHLSVSYWWSVFGDITKKAIDRNMFPYILRHTRATELQKKLTAKIYEKVMDHSIEMATRYSHLNKDDVREAMLESVYHVEEPTLEEKDRIKELEKETKKLKNTLRLILDSGLENIGDAIEKQDPKQIVLSWNKIREAKKELI